MFIHLFNLPVKLQIADNALHISRESLDICSEVGYKMLRIVAQLCQIKS